MDMAEDIVVLSDRRRLTFREASDNEGTEEVIIMARVVVGMAEVVIQAAVRTTHHGQSSSGDMAVVAVAVVEGSQSGQSTRLTDGLEGLVQLILLGGLSNRRLSPVPRSKQFSPHCRVIEEKDLWYNSSSRVTRG